MSNINDPVSLNVRGVRELISSKINKIQGGAVNQPEGQVGEEIDEFELKMSDEELLSLKNQWELEYGPYEKPITARQDANKKYYMGRQLEGTEYKTDFPIASNLLFEAEETFLPVALSKNPEPVVWCDNTEEGNQLSNDVKTMLQFHADTLVLRQKMTMMTRHWTIYLMGILKHGFDDTISDIKTEVRNPQNFIFDPEGSVDMYGDFDSWLGERITVPASRLIEMFPSFEVEIEASVNGKLGTKVIYTEWWTDEYCFYTYKDLVLDKHKNQFFLYDEEKGRNHFTKPKKPYTFLSVFSLGEQPHDVTSLIEQNIPNQNLITKRTMQIDANLSRQNNSVAFSGDNFTQQTAKQASSAFEKGNPVLVPTGRPIAEAIVRFPAQPYPEAAFKELANNKESLRTSFGTEGITAQPEDNQSTARGMILQQQMDSSRIGGGIGDKLEQVADNTFNWWVQLYHVFYDEPHIASILGRNKASEVVELSNSQFNRQLVISVSPGSMKPKDEITTMNQALELWNAKALDPKTLLTILNVPDPEKTAENVVLWLTNPQMYVQANFPQLMGAPAQSAQSAPIQGNVPGTPEPNLGGEPANASLSQVPLPK